MSILDQIGGESIPSAFDKNSALGETVTGTIVKAELIQKRDFATGKPETWDDGNPKNQVRIVLDVGGGNKVAIYVKAWGIHAGNLKDAVHAAGMTDLDVGATFTATYARDIPSEQKGFSPTKVYEYTLKPASQTAAIFNPPAEPAPDPAAATGDSVVDQIKQLHSIGLDSAAIKAALGDNPAVNDQVIAAVIAAA